MNKKYFSAFLFLIILFCALIIPKISQAYKGHRIYCFGWNDCKINDSNCSQRTLICPDDREGYNVFCKSTTQQCTYLDSCSLGIIEECGYALISTSMPTSTPTPTPTPTPISIPAPTVDLLVNRGGHSITISSGESATLSWTSTNATSCVASDDWSGKKILNGSEVVKPNQTSEYILTCIGNGGSASDKVTVRVSATPTPVAVGNLNVKIRLNGVEISTSVPVEYQFFGPQTLEGSFAPQLFNDADASFNNSYIGSYISGGPEKSTFLGFSPSQSVHITPGQTTTVYLDFTDGAGLCNITVEAIKTSCDGSGQSPWTGALSYGLLGPAILNGMTVDQTFENIPSGRYYLTSLVGGPGTYNGVSPGNPIACPSGSNVTLQMRFKDCGETHYKCNYSTGACESCDVYSGDCKYSVFNDCKTQCSGCTGPHTPVANVFCWANFDSDTCTGVNDGNANTPSVILYDKSSDECGDAESCHWKIYDSSGNLIKSADTCAPYPWYDETPGTYTGELTVTDSQGNSSTDRQKFIIKNIDTLTCNFVWDPTSPTASGVTSFFDQTLTPSGTSLKSWSWTFEGATPASSTAQNISNVKFNSAGAKTITLTVKNSANKTCTISKQIQVKTINPYWKEVIPD